jgi:crossover junction endodeoxyribonuclease RusA
MLVLPWPPKELSPNARVHRLAKARAAKAYRHACWVLTKEAGVSLGDLPMHLKITFVPPTRQARDLDNCLAAIKSGIDGMADALKVNDRDFRPLTVDIAPDIGGMVVVEFLEN